MTETPTPPRPPAAPRLRVHQRRLLEIVERIAQGEERARDILAAVTPGGGKSLLPVIAAARLVGAGVVERVVWIVPRDSLRLQAEEAFADPVWRRHLGHALSVRAADNGRDPSRGLAGYVTTYQAIAAAPALHLAEARRWRTLVVTDEVHHLPALEDAPDEEAIAAAPAAAPDEPAPDLFAVAAPETGPDPARDPDGAPAAEDASAWSAALAPVLGAAQLRLHLSGTLERADGRAILWLPYRRSRVAAKAREVDLDAPGWRVIGYSRAQALRDRAVLPVTFGALDGEARWSVRAERAAAAEGEPDAEGRITLGPHRLSGAMPSETTRPALFAALRTEFAEALLRESFIALTELRAERRARLGPKAARGLGKLLVVAPDQACARRYLEMVRGWLPPARAEREARLATSSERDAHETLAAFRLTPEPSILVTVAMAYEGLDAPEVAVVAALTHIRSRPWLEQMIARATRIDPHAGPVDAQRALVFHPDDPLFARFRHRIETEQGTLARPRGRKRPALDLPLWLAAERAALREAEGPELLPLDSRATGLRYATLRPGPEFAEARPEMQAEAHLDIEAWPLAPAGPDGDPGAAPAPPLTPSAVERRLRSRLADAVARQVVEDEGGAAAGRGAGQLAFGPHAAHRYNAVLKRVTGRGRGEMGLAELEAALAWLERNRLRDHLHLLEGDARYAWDARRVVKEARARARRSRAPDPRQEALRLD